MATSRATPPEKPNRRGKPIRNRLQSCDADRSPAVAAGMDQARQLVEAIPKADQPIKKFRPRQRTIIGIRSRRTRWYSKREEKTRPRPNYLTRTLFARRKSHRAESSSSPRRECWKHADL